MHRLQVQHGLGKRVPTSIDDDYGRLVQGTHRRRIHADKHHIHRAAQCFDGTAGRRQEANSVHNSGAKRVDQLQKQAVEFAYDRPDVWTYHQCKGVSDAWVEIKARQRRNDERWRTHMVHRQPLRGIFDCVSLPETQSFRQ